MLARFAILRLQLVLEGEPGPQRRVRPSPVPLQPRTAVLTATATAAECRAQPRSFVNLLWALNPCRSRLDVARDVMVKSCQKSAWGAPARVSSRVHAYQAKS